MNDPIQHLRELLPKATPVPWNGDYLWRLLRYGRNAGFYEAESDGENPNTPEDGDAALIVAAINALPHLLAVAEAARKATQGIGNLCEFDAIGYSRLGDLESLEAALAKLDEVKP